MTVPVPTVPPPVVLSTDENPSVEAPVVANSMTEEVGKKTKEGGRECPKCGRACEDGMDCVAGCTCLAAAVLALFFCAW